jgi:hypothetical protein
MSIRPMYIYPFSPYMSIEVRLTDLQQQAHATAQAKGFYNGDHRSIYEIFAGIHSEVSEVWDASRIRGTYDIIEGEKPQGVPIEIADVFIFAADIAQYTGVHLETMAQRLFQTETVDTVNSFMDHAYAPMRTSFDYRPVTLGFSIAETHRLFARALEQYDSGCQNHIGKDAKGNWLGFGINLTAGLAPLAILACDANIDLNYAIQTKLAYNASRPIGHGKHHS